MMIRSNTRFGLSFLSGITLLFLLFLSNSSVQAQSYQTLQAGAWSNTTNVWSTDGGVSPCFCAPPTTLNAGEQIIIYHDITNANDIEINNGSEIDVTISGQLQMPLHKMFINNGTMVSAGTVEINEMEIGVAGTYSAFGFAIVYFGLIVEGNLNIGHHLYLESANLKVASGGTVTFTNSGLIEFLNGNVANEGTINFNNSCILILNGNFDNKGGSTVAGTGFVSLQNGSAVNDGIWSVSVEWCGTGGGPGVPTPSNCGIDPCFTILGPGDEPIDLHAFNREAFIELDWTPIEQDSVVYEVLRSDDLNNFELISTLNAMDYSAFVSGDHLYHDRTAKPGVNYYRIHIKKNDGSSYFSETIAVDCSLETSGVVLFPNPAIDQNLTVFLLFKYTRQGTVSIVTSEGKTCLSREFYHNGDSSSLELDTQSLHAGIYFVKVSDADGRTLDTQKLIIQ